jgi:uncharacterized protein YjbI with pentapeptide repeats
LYQSRSSVSKFAIPFPEEANWHSEELLLSAFFPEKRGVPLAESHTHADEVFGNFITGSAAVDELETLLKAHERWVTSSGQAGRRADLAFKQLRAVDFSKRQLCRANFTGSDLAGARFTGADVDGALFVDSNLANTDFSESIGLVSRQLAGANLTNATLPEYVQDAFGLKYIEETCRNARATFFTLIFACIYSWLVIITTQDRELVIEGDVVPLPIISTAIPMSAFYLITPILIISVFLYFHLYLQRLWSGLAEMPAVFPDGRPLQSRVYPWILTGIVRSRFKNLAPTADVFSRFEELVSIIFAWWIVPATILAFWAGFLPRHEWLGSLLHVVVFISSLFLCFVFWESASRSLKEKRIKSVGLRELFGVRSHVIVTSMATVIILVLTFGAVEALSIQKRDQAHAFDPRYWVPPFLESFGVGTRLDFRNAELSSPPSDFDKDNPDDVGRVRGANLADRNLILMDGESSLLARANLRGADLSGANLRIANLRKADLTGAMLAGADLRGARLRQAIFKDADLSGVLLDKDTELDQAYFVGAKVHGVDFSKVKGLEKRQLVDAAGNMNTTLPDGIDPCMGCPE